MARLLDTIEYLRDLSGTVAGLEKALAERPKDDGLRHMLLSIEQQRKNLEEVFEKESRSAGVDICNYRLFGPNDRTASLIFTAMAKFQDVLTATYASVATKKPRTNRRVGKEYTEQTKLDFAFSYSGSSGFVFTMPQERLLVGESVLDEAISSVFAMAKATSPDELKAFAGRFGVGVIRELRDWVLAQSDGELGADIDWRRGEEIRGELFVQPQELSMLRDLIMATSESVEETLHVSGQLTGVLPEAGRFEFKANAGETYRGILGVPVDADHPITLPHSCTAIIQQVTTWHYSTDEEKVEHTLVELS